MKKVLFIAALVALASCSNEISTSSKDSVCTDSTCSDSMNTDSLIKSSEAHIDTMNALLKEVKK
jgi:ABC-type oligopeptide transport system substrate-binding subunit